MIVGTAGHIDHGKTSLVKALTGVDADRLKEEKERGITIDLGFAYQPRPDGRVTGFVDVPGHERFVHTMLAGAQALDLALLVVAADDGVMPQTREHLEIISLLGLDRLMVALTKIDAVSPQRRDEAAAQIAAWLAETRFSGAPILPVSSLTGEGLPALVTALDALAASLAPREGARAFRLSVDRCFTLKGEGVVVTGMALDGAVSAGDEVVVSPTGLTARVRSIHAQNRRVERGEAGDRLALNLAGPRVTREAIRRGDMILPPNAAAPTQRIDARVTLAPGAGKGVRAWTPARLHHATAEVGARLVPLDEEALTGESALMQLVLDAPIAARALDRFVLRDVSASRTLGGGVFLDLRAPDRRRRSPERRAILAALEEADPARALRAVLEASAAPVDLDVFARDRGADDAAAARWAAQADAETFMLARRGVALSRARIAQWRAAAVETLAAFHADNPDLAGMGLERLRLLVAPRAPAPLFRALLRDFAQEGALALDGSWLRLPSHRVELSPAEDDLWSALRGRLAGAERFRPPRVRDVAGALGEEEETIRRLFRRLARAGALHDVAQDHFFLRAVLAQAVEIAVAVEAGAAGWFAAGAYRDALEAASGASVGRKVAIQILEFLDRHGVTIRRGDQRRINPHRRDLFADVAGDATKGASDSGREASPVGRPDFKSGWGRETVSGGFDSHSLPPSLPIAPEPEG